MRKTIKEWIYLMSRKRQRLTFLLSFRFLSRLSLQRLVNENQEGYFIQEYPSLSCNRMLTWVIDLPINLKDKLPLMDPYLTLFLLFSLKTKGQTMKSAQPFFSSLLFWITCQWLHTKNHIYIRIPSKERRLSTPWYLWMIHPLMSLSLIGIHGLRK